MSSISDDLKNGFNAILEIVSRLEKENVEIKRQVDLNSKSDVELKVKFDSMEKENIELRKQIEKIDIEKNQINEILENVRENYNIQRRCYLSSEAKLEKMEEKFKRACEFADESRDEYCAKIKNLKHELDQVKNSIILSTEKANRSGGKSTLTDEQIEYIKQASKEELSLRKIGEMIDKSHMTIKRFLDSQKDNQSVTNEYDVTNSEIPKTNNFQKKDDYKVTTNHFNEDVTIVGDDVEDLY